MKRRSQTPEEASYRASVSTFFRYRRPILFFSGLAGIFAYTGVVEFAGEPFHFEFLLVFLAMMGVSLTQGLEV